jgi:hypothetical protein
MLAFQPLGVPNVRSSMPLLAFKPVGRSAVDMSSGRNRVLDAWKCAVKRSLGA